MGNEEKYKSAMKKKGKIKKDQKEYKWLYTKHRIVHSFIIYLFFKIFITADIFR